jgi:dynein heavy chain, axonemal
LFTTISDKLPRTPLKFHYIFNLRNISSVYEGLYGAVLDKTQTKGAIARLWRHECICIFADRLINAQDRTLVCGQLIPDLVKRFFKDVEEEVMADPIIYGDYAQSDPSFEEGEDPRLYEDLGTFEKIREKMEKMLEEYNFENPPMGLVLFDECLSHVTKVHRIIRFKKGCAMLVGYGGSGKQSVTKLATYVAGYKVWTINLIRNYKESDFRADLQELYKVVLKKPRSFLFTDAHAVDEGFFELINNILTIGMVPALFPEEEKEGFCQMVDADIKKNKLPDSKDARWSYFVRKARENIHIILAMSPAGETLKVRCRNFPGLVSNTTIDWFFPWPLDALNDVAVNFLSEIELDSDIRKPVQDHITRVHLTM